MGSLSQLVSVEILGDLEADSRHVHGDVSAPERGRGGHSGGDCLARAEGGRIGDVPIDDETDELVHGVDVSVAVATRVPAQGDLEVGNGLVAAAVRPHANSRLRRHRSFRLGRACQ